MTPAPKRRWLRFGLRTMFAVVTSAGLVFAAERWASNWAAERQAFLQSKWFPMAGARLEGGSAPFPLWLLGEPGILEMKVGFVGPPGVPVSEFFHPSPEQQEELERIRRLFPEARVEGYIGTAAF